MQEGISNIEDQGEQIDDEGETSEEGYKEGFNQERDSGKERRECISDQTKGTCVIWCEKMPFWNLLVGAIDLRVTGIWGEVRCGGTSLEDGGRAHHGTRRVPAQDVLFALILWYVAKNIFRSQ